MNVFFFYIYMACSFKRMLFSAPVNSFRAMLYHFAEDISCSSGSCALKYCIYQYFERTQILHSVSVFIFEELSK